MIGSLQNGDEFVVRAVARSFVVQIMQQASSNSRWHGQVTLLVSLAFDPDIIVDKIEITDFEPQNFTRSEPAEKHEIDDHLIAIFSDTRQKLFDFG